jgi:glycosyltransferase involved in cell wall biosynthesis
VVLEAGLLGIPTVCFAGSGAIPEMADQGCCIRVDYLDLPAFATAVHQLCLNPETASAIGELCRQKVSRDLTLNMVAPQVAAVLLEGR